MFDVLFTFFSTFWFYLWRYKRSERRKSPLSINISMFWFYLWRWERSLRRKSIFDVLIVGVLINSKDIFDVLISTFWSTKKTISTFWLSTEFSEFFLVFDVVIFVVLTFSPYFWIRSDVLNWLPNDWDAVGTFSDVVVEGKGVTLGRVLKIKQCNSF